MVGVGVLHHAVVDDVAIDPTSDHDAEFAIKRDDRLDDEALATERLPHRSDIGRIGDPHLPLPVVTESGRLGDHGHAELGNGRRKLGLGFGRAPRGDCDTGCRECFLLELSVLGSGDNRTRGTSRHAGSFGCISDGGVDILEFPGHRIDQLEEGGDRCWIVDTP